MTAQLDVDHLQAGLRGLAGSAEPTEATMTLIDEGVTGDALMLIDGELVASSSGATFPNVDPTTEEVLGDVADATPEDLDRAISAARRAFDNTTWASDPEFRKHCLMQFHAAMVRNADLLRATAVIEGGIAVRTTNTMHSDAAIGTIPYWAEMATNYEYERALPDRPWAYGSRHLIRREAIGVVAAITPWNFPLVTAMTKVLPALAAGATVILKPAVQTPWHATLIARLIAEETDFPAGVFNIVTPLDNNVAELLATDPRVDLIHFTGSTAVGKKLMALASTRVARVALELGGKSANIMLPDVNLEQVVPFAAGMVSLNSGQGCILPTRMLVHQDRYDEAVEIVRVTYENMPFGDPRDPDVVQGPQISELQRSRILDLVAAGVSEGAQLVTGGAKPAQFEKGYFVQPTLLANVDENSTVAQREIFGPVLSLIPYTDVDDAVRIANNSTYGLAGYIWSPDEDAALGVARRIRSGMLAINGGFFFAPDLPWGGYKQSGIGRESGVEGFEEFLETKTLAVGNFR